MLSLGYDPAETMEQLVELPVDEYVPAGQGVHTVAPLFTPKDPGSQGRQLDELEAPTNAL